MVSCLAVIPCRGGSKGVHRKNLREIDGIPLVAHTIHAANASKLITRTIVSTDDDEIASVAKEYGGDVPFIRPEKYATDQAKSIDVVLHALNKCSEQFKEQYDYLILLQPTSPFRDNIHIDSAIKMLVGNKNAESLISVKEVPNECNPHYIYKILDNRYCEPLIESAEIIRRQDQPKSYVRNGAIYVVKVSYLLQNESLLAAKNLAYEMDDESSINIDTELDLIVARSIADTRQASNK
jgi:CMP-N,N'-diacetyllegionaminic acid synthase